MKASLQRLAIMSSDQYKGVKLTLSKDLLNLSTINSQNESGDESLECQYSGDSLEIGFNLSYLIETLDVIETPNIAIHLGSSDSGCLVTAENNESSKYIIDTIKHTVPIWKKEHFLDGVAEWSMGCEATSVVENVHKASKFVK